MIVKNSSPPASGKAPNYTTKVAVVLDPSGRVMLDECMGLRLQQSPGQGRLTQSSLLYEALEHYHRFLKLKERDRDRPSEAPPATAAR